MSFQTPRFRITVVKRTLNLDLIEKYGIDEHRDMGRCKHFEDGQECVAEEYDSIPEGFCNWAWADIRKDIWALARGANMPVMRQPGTMISGCTNWFRPVIFRIERLEDT
jgi:uncharacterized repeat protein (TIGR04076 family)